MTTTRKTKKTYSKDEHILQRQVTNLAMYHGWLVLRVNSGSVTDAKRYTNFYTIANTKEHSGLSDLILFKNGKAVFFEVKRKGGKQTENQKEFESLAECHGMQYFLIDSFDKSVEVLKGL